MPVCLVRGVPACGGGGARVCDMVCVVHGCQGVVWMHVV